MNSRLLSLFENNHEFWSKICQHKKSFFGKIFLFSICGKNFSVKIVGPNFLLKLLIIFSARILCENFDCNFSSTFGHVTIKLGSILDKKCKFLMKMCILVDHNLDSLTKICSAKITHFRCKILRYQLTHPSDSFPIFSSDKNLKIFI